ncbi:SpoIIE family protein phosphatase [Haliovirga abyssi]|uniref:Response regulatory domain-containing protein n=1 Tax=Haliovirga abyssi TaxID=2996794 RepID=A0AAU9DPR9_9FUSO|nr:SpoIIE family protein phosphatase [Haliovirga abyssi]BDU50443.1 hypothetical protein HLVA_10120 [Haliovirga abyssi]
MKLLIVEDEKYVAFLLEEFLKKMGINNFDIVFSFKEAINILKDKKYDIILADNGLPDGTGLELLKKVKKIDSFATVVFITGSDDSDLLIGLINNGAYAYLKKPIDYSEFEFTVNKSIEYRKLLNENIKLTKEMIKKKEIEKELKLAKEIQENILLKILPNRLNLEMYAISKPAKFVGGDFYDVINISEDEIIFVIGDVSGKGLKSSIAMVMLLSIIRTLVEKRIPLSNILYELNRNLFSSNIKMSATCFIGKLNTKTLSLKYVNAGHEYPLIFRDENIIEVENGDLLLGAVDESRFQEYEVQLLDQDYLFLYTDGISELYEDLEVLKIKIKEFLSKEQNLKNSVLNFLKWDNINNKEIILDDKTILGIKIENILSVKKEASYHLIANTHEILNLKIFLKELFSYLKLNDEDEFNLNFTINELVTNSIQHGYLNGTGIIDMSFKLISKDFLQIKIKDYGIGINKNILKNLNENIIDSAALRGRGIYICKKLTDNFQINVNEGKGTEIIFTKKISR